MAEVSLSLLVSRRAIVIIFNNLFYKVQKFLSWYFALSTSNKYVPETTVKTQNLQFLIKGRKMSINKTVVKIINKAFTLPVGDETENHVMFMSAMPIFSCLEVWYENVSKY